MAEWKAYKNIRRLYKEDDDYLMFYYNKTYSRQTLSLANMLLEEIHKDFPEKSADDVFIGMLKNPPNEIVLSFALPKYEVEHFDLSQFEKIPDDFLELK